MEIFFKAENQMMADYVCYLFPPKGKEEINTVRSSHPFGRLIIGHCRESFMPQEAPPGNHIIRLRIPYGRNTQFMANKYVWLSGHDIRLLNTALKGFFDMDLMAYYLKGQSLGFQKKEIVEAFCMSRGLVSSDAFDAVHKRVYRREQEKMRALTAILDRKVRYINESLDTTGLTSRIRI